MAFLDSGASGIPDLGWLSPNFRPLDSAEGQAQQANQAREIAAQILAQRMRRQAPAAAPVAAAADDSGMAWPVAGASPALQLPGPASLAAAAPAAPVAEPAVSGAPGPGESVPMPPTRPVSVPKLPMVTLPPTGDAEIPANATPTVGGPVPGGPGAVAHPAAAPGPLSKFGDWLTNNSQTLMALGAGFAGAPSLGQGFSRALTMAGPVAQQNQTINALVAKGMSPEIARAAASNPAILQQLIPAMFGPKQLKFGQIGEDMLGTKQFGFIDEVRGITYDSHGRAMNAPGGGTVAGPGGATRATPAGSVGIDNFANANHELTGEDYLKQFNPELRAAVQDYVAGRATPTGNPRKGFTQAVKMIAQKYGNDLGTPADDTTFTARRTMRNQLSSATPASLGGQINIGNTAMGHLADLTQKALDLGNWDVGGIAMLGHAANKFRGLGTEQSAKMEALKGAAQHYGQEITKFYAGSPGGEGERNRFMSSVDAAKTPKELAAVLETEGELMHSRLHSLGSQIEGVLGPAGTKEYPVIRPESQKALKTIAGNIGKLRGSEAAAAAPAPAGGGWSVQRVQ